MQRSWSTCVLPDVKSEKCGYLFVNYLGKWLENCLEMYHTITKDMEPEALDIRLSIGIYDIRQSIHFSEPQLSHL